MECDGEGENISERRRAACPFCDPPVELITMCHACSWTHVPNTPAAQALMDSVASGEEIPEPEGREFVPSGNMFTGVYRCGGCHNLVGCLCPHCHRNVGLNASIISTCAQAVKRRRKNTDTRASPLHSTPAEPAR